MGVKRTRRKLERADPVAILRRMPRSPTPREYHPGIKNESKSRKNGSSPADGTRRNRESEVLAAAIRVFARNGYSGASVQDVADEVGVLKGSLYHYTDSKETLLMRVIDDAHAQAIEIIEGVRKMEGPPSFRLWTYFRRHVNWYLETLEQASIFFHEWKYLDDERLAIVKKRRKGYELFVRELIVESQREKEIDPELSPKYAQLYISGAINAVPDWYDPNGRDKPATIAKRFADLTLNVLTGTSDRLMQNWEAEDLRP